MKQLNPKSLSVLDIQGILTSGIGPRPIALVSTLSETGERNLAPFSFFNAFGANPPTVVFSPARRGRDGSLKDTYYNIKATKECVVSVVTHDMVEQVSLASTEYDTGIDEFVKSGLTPVKSELIKPYGVKESPLWMECKVNDIIHLGESNGSGNLIVAEVVMFHVAEDAMVDGKFNHNLLDVVGRFGQNYYVRASGDAMFEVAKPTAKGIGMDALPTVLKESFTYSANNLARFANALALPSKSDIEAFIKANSSENTFEEALFYRFERAENAEQMLQLALSSKNEKQERFQFFIEKTAQMFLRLNKFDEALNTAMIIEYI